MKSLRKTFLIKGHDQPVTIHWASILSLKLGQWWGQTEA